MTIFIKAPYFDFNTLADRATVVSYGNMANAWTFATAHSPNDGAHPVSGNRTFGYTVNGDGSYTFFTRGVDRMTNWFGNALQQSFGTPFSSADALWTSAMNGIAANVRANGGTATVNAPQTYRPDWNKVKGVLNGTTAASAFTGCKNGILVE
ncbi:MAG: hypothetical protein IAE99_12285 [Rhodothermales bacterium]|nr:hypothetical protein [Rhodothermales bacterium]